MIFRVAVIPVAFLNLLPVQLKVTVPDKSSSVMGKCALILHVWHPNFKSGFKSVILVLSTIKWLYFSRGNTNYIITLIA